MAAEAFKFAGFVEALKNWGLVEMLIFLLIFVIIFAVLQKTKILGEGKKNLNVVVALVVAALVIIPHLTRQFPTDADPVEIIKESLPQVSLVLVAIVFLLILIGVFGQDMVLLGVAMPGWITFISLAIIIWIFGGAAGWWSSGFDQFLEDNFGSEAVAVVIMLLVFGVVIAWITAESKDEKMGLKRFGIDLDKLFKK